MAIEHLLVRRLGLQEYQEVWQAMSRYTDQRDEQSLDELWLVQHPPVFTQGQAGKPEHILNSANIPVVQSDRGGQVTYHGPGQLVLYPLIDLRRRDMGVRAMVTLLEQVAIAFLQGFGIQSHAKSDAPGVYVLTNDGVEAKIASLGLRVRRGCSFHGMSINIDMDLSPFEQINPCGYQGMPVTQLHNLLECSTIDFSELESAIIHLMSESLSCSSVQLVDDFPPY